MWLVGAVGIEITTPQSKSRKRNGVAPPPLFNWSLLEPSGRDARRSTPTDLHCRPSGSGPGGRRFKSSRPDHILLIRLTQFSRNCAVLSRITRIKRFPLVQAKTLPARLLQHLQTEVRQRSDTPPQGRLSMKSGTLPGLPPCVHRITPGARSLRKRESTGDGPAGAFVICPKT